MKLFVLALKIELIFCYFRPKDEEDEKSAKLTKESDALRKLKQVLNPDDLNFLRSRLSLPSESEIPRSPKKLSNSDFDKLLSRGPTREVPRSILDKQEIENIKSKATQEDKLAKLELLLKGIL